MSDLLHISPDIQARFPGYKGLVLVAKGLTNGPSDERSRGWLSDAEAHARAQFTDLPPAQHPHLQAWHEAFRAFGVKPKKMLNSAEALIARVLKGGTLPAINRLTDAYNAVSVRFVVPCGGEDLRHVTAPVTLTIADGSEPFETNKDGTAFTDHPPAGEVVWADGQGVTCRAWNWRQGTRTRLTETTTEAYFLFDALPPVTWQHLEAAGDELEQLLREIAPEVQLQRLRLSAAVNHAEA